MGELKVFVFSKKIGSAWGANGFLQGAGKWLGFSASAGWKMKMVMVVMMMMMMMMSFIVFVDDAIAMQMHGLHGHQKPHLTLGLVLVLCEAVEG